MSESAVSHQRQQEKVDAYFHSEASFWKDIYASNSVQAEIIRERQAKALAWIDNLALAPGSQVLEIGCGAGFLAVTLARRGLRVQAIDSVEAMVELARQHAAEAGAAELLSVDIGDAYALSFADESFDLVVVLGVIGWLEKPGLAMLEMARVTRPGGYVILTASNWAELRRLLDPWQNPTIAALRRRVGDLLERIGLRYRSPHPTSRASRIFHRQRYIDAALARAGLVKMRSTTIGFGPFSLSWRHLFPESVGVALHHRLQRLADRGVPPFRSTGMSYLVLARKVSSDSNGSGSEGDRRATAPLEEKGTRN